MIVQFLVLDHRAIIAHAPAPPKTHMVRQAFSMWAILAVLGLTLLIVALAVLRLGRRRAQAARRRRTTLYPSAWEEAGRRAEGITVDIDPPPNPEDPR